ncbi:hypothetical protein AX769_15515 [Frondihabitans sp. PAMC 28766]|uniref:transglutaminaseTgpA domain-containing protein n=1 Tax=Frondihabitans sp. PAMC 28766 TaxID=1795630 RepID=UPI00078C6EE7|nr:transglutaminaseTgpA domain-containing protein [Frondihabitans sp. PAMC 28766]AMM21282.1 hypothetical protein AX769_15515 [Frondihabitans sp. PAMC 28766]
MVDLVTRPAPPASDGGGELPARFAPGHARWGLTLALWFTLFASIASLGPLFQGSGWLVGVAFVTALVFAAMASARAVHWPVVAVYVAGLVVAAIACVVTVSGGTAVLGFIPTSETAERVRLLLQQANETIVAGQAPVTVSPAILAVVIASVAAASIVVDLLARAGRIPTLTGVVFVVVLAVPSLIPGCRPTGSGWSSPSSATPPSS